MFLCMLRFRFYLKLHVSQVHVKSLRHHPQGAGFKNAILLGQLVRYIMQLYVFVYEIIIALRYCSFKGMIYLKNNGSAFIYSCMFFRCTRNIYVITHKKLGSETQYCSVSWYVTLCSCMYLYMQL
jgi:hypothetical protein